MKIKIVIEEHIGKVFEVESDTLDEAMQIAEDKYYGGEFVIEDVNATTRLMMADDGNKQTDWEEF